MPPVVIYAAKCIDSGLAQWKGDSFVLWRESCGYSISDITILFNLSLPNIYNYNNGRTKFGLLWRLAMAYIAENPVKID